MNTLNLNLENGKALVGKEKCLKEKKEMSPIDKTPSLSSSNTISQPCGLTNLGNTCFFNSVMQCLLNTHVIKEYTLNVSKATTLEVPKRDVYINDNKVSLDEMVIKVEPEKFRLTESFKKFYITFTSMKRVDPRELFFEICAKADRFRGWAQQDAHELLRYLMDGLKTEEIDRFKKAIVNELHFPISGKEAKPEDAQYARAILEVGRKPMIDRVFGGSLVQTLTCCRCKYVSSRLEPFMDLSLPLASMATTSPIPKPITNFVNNRHPEAKKAKKDSRMKISSSRENDDIDNDFFDGDIDEKKDEFDESSGSGFEEEITSDGEQEMDEFDNYQLNNNFNCSQNHLDRYRERLVEIDGDDCSNERSVYNCLKQFTSEEDLTGSNSYECEKCCLEFNKKKLKENPKAKKKMVEAKKKYLIYSPPVILTLHLKRFEQVHNSIYARTRKIPGYVNFDFELDLAPFVAKHGQRIVPGEKRVLYRLYGIVVHSGGLSGGHYIAYVKTRREIPYIKEFFNNAASYDDFMKQITERDEDECLKDIPKKYNEHHEDFNKDGRWYCCSDSSVHAVDVDQVSKCEAYILFYERMI
uniref:Ubiquitin carboxyl-terminal hydrolase n=1 Tax=Strongyloides stercoralis TaxID=6248 RepID=A0A913IBP8_STRER